MKRFILIAASALFLSACSGDNQETKGEKSNHKDTQDKDVEVGLFVEVGTVKHYEWIDQSTDDEKITVYAELINKSDVNVEIDLASVSYMDAKEDILAVEGEYVTPNYLQPNETAYLISETDDPTVISELSEIEVNPSYIEAPDVEITKFKVNDESMKVDTWSDNNSKISVTGSIANESDIDFGEDDINVSLGLYDEDDNLIGVESIYSDQALALKANEERKFEFGGGGPLPDEIKDKIKRIEVTVVGVKEDY